MSSRALRLEGNSLLRRPIGFPPRLASNSAGEQLCRLAIEVGGQRSEEEGRRAREVGQKSLGVELMRRKLPPAGGAGFMSEMDMADIDILTENINKL